MYRFTIHFYYQKNELNKIYMNTYNKKYFKNFYGNEKDNIIINFYTNQDYIINNSNFFVKKNKNLFKIIKIDKRKLQNELVKSDNFLINLYNQFEKKQIYISESLKHLENTFCINYNVETYHDKNKPLLIFGLYDKIDFNVLYKHKAKVYIIWGGSDCLYNNNNVKMAKLLDNIKEIEHLIISEYIYDKICKYKLKNRKEILLTFCAGKKDYDDNFSTDESNLIYAYDGIGESNEKKNEIYNKEILDKLENKIGYELFRSSKNDFIDDIASIYRKAFMGLRLTKYDGNANSCQEMGEMGLPVICNISMNHAIPWHNEEDILFKINYIKRKRIRIKYKLNKPRILIICSDFPNNGGAATNTIFLNDYFNSHGFNSTAIFLNEDQKTFEDYDDNGLYKNIVILNELKYNTALINYVENQENYDKIILRTSLNSNVLKSIKIKTNKLYFFVPGIFKNNLDKNPFNFETKNWVNDNLQYINLSNLNAVKYCDEVFCNSNLTKRIMEIFLGKKIEDKINILNFVALRQNKKNLLKKWVDREYDLIFITNNFSRDIKNFNLAIEIYKSFPSLKKIIVGDGEIDLLNNIPNVTYYSTLSDNEIYSLLENTKISINTSYFDSFSNVSWNALQNGCNLIVSKNNGIAQYLGEENIVKTYELKDWVNKIENSLKEQNSITEKIDKLFWETEVNIMEILSR